MTVRLILTCQVFRTIQKRPRLAASTPMTTGRAAWRMRGRFFTPRSNVLRSLVPLQARLPSKTWIRAWWRSARPAVWIFLPWDRLLRPRLPRQTGLSTTGAISSRHPKTTRTLEIGRLRPRGTSKRRRMTRMVRLSALWTSFPSYGRESARLGHGAACPLSQGPNQRPSPQSSRRRSSPRVSFRQGRQSRLPRLRRTSRLPRTTCWRASLMALPRRGRVRSWVVPSMGSVSFGDVCSWAMGRGTSRSHLR